MNDAMMKPENERQELAALTAQATTQAMMQVLEPVFSGMGQMAQMMAQTAQQMRMLQESMENMQKTMMLSVPLTGTQARMLSAAVKERAESIRKKYGLDDAARQECARAIRKKLCRRWAVAGMKEIPRSEYALAMETVERFDESDVVLKYI